jgi:hypothetical protein
MQIETTTDIARAFASPSREAATMLAAFVSITRAAHGFEAITPGLSVEVREGGVNGPSFVVAIPEDGGRVYVAFPGQGDKARAANHRPVAVQALKAGDLALLLGRYRKITKVEREGNRINLDVAPLPFEDGGDRCVAYTFAQNSTIDATVREPIEPWTLTNDNGDATPFDTWDDAEAFAANVPGGFVEALWEAFVIIVERPEGFRWVKLAD